MDGIFRDRYIVVRLVQMATPSGGVEGKIALQKLLYFFSLRHGRFIYRWGAYGPFCIDVQQAVHDFEDTGEIRAEPVPAESGGVFRNRLTHQGYPDDEAVPRDLSEFPADLEDGLKSVLDLAGRIGRERQPRALELLASVHYLAVSQGSSGGGYDVKSVHEHLDALKPDAGFTEDEVAESLAMLKEHGYL